MILSRIRRFGLKANHIEPVVFPLYHLIEEIYEMLANLNKDGALDLIKVREVQQALVAGVLMGEENTSRLIDLHQSGLIKDLHLAKAMGFNEGNIATLWRSQDDFCQLLARESWKETDYFNLLDGIWNKDEWLFRSLSSHQDLHLADLKKTFESRFRFG